MFLYRRYRLPIIITENGMANNDSITDGEVRDDVRIGFMNDYLSNVRRAIDDGVKVFGYQHWSLMDNFEWSRGLRTEVRAYMSIIKRSSAH